MKLINILKSLVEEHGLEINTKTEMDGFTFSKSLNYRGRRSPVYYRIFVDNFDVKISRIDMDYKGVHFMPTPLILLSVDIRDPSSLNNISQLLKNIQSNLK